MRREQGPRFLGIRSLLNASIVAIKNETKRRKSEKENTKNQRSSAIVTKHESNTTTYIRLLAREITSLGGVEERS